MERDEEDRCNMFSNTLLKSFVKVIAVARTANIIFIVLDVLKPLGHKKILENELEGFGIRMNKAPPNIIYKKKDKGGINLQVMVPQSELDLDLIKEILGEYRQGIVLCICSTYLLRISNADITLRCDATVDDLIDVVEGNRQVSFSKPDPYTFLYQELHTLHLLAQQD